jgi:hypothetical protein
MGIEIKYNCDVCNKKICEGHQQLYMVRLTVDSVETVSDGGITTENHTDVYHVHNDFSNQCMGKLWDILVKGRK